MDEIFDLLLAKKYPELEGFKIIKVSVHTSVDAYSIRADSFRNDFWTDVTYEVDGEQSSICFGGIIGQFDSRSIRNTFIERWTEELSYESLKYQMLMEYVNARHYASDGPPSSLPRAVSKFITYLIDEYFPLGIPTANHLVQAKRLLLTMKNWIDQNKNCVPLNLSNRFYEMMPHKGVENRRPAFNIDVFNMKYPYVERMTNTLEALTNARNSDEENPIDHFLRNWLRAEISVVDSTTNDYKQLSYVVRKTQHPNLSQYHIKKIFKVTTEHEFAKDIPNHHYLFHQSFPSNLLGILREGLLVAPPHSFSFKRRFGEGIYFWNAIANAGIQFKSMDTVYVLVCRVALGRMKQITSRQDVKGFLGSDGDSAFCGGGIYVEGMPCASPYGSVREKTKTLNGATIFCGRMNVTIGSRRYSENYDEYVVPSANQVKVEYILKLEQANINCR